MKVAFIFSGFILLIFISACTPDKTNKSIDEQTIRAAIDNWNKGWAERNAALAIQDYADNTDWTNAFGARVKSKSELKELLDTIFSMDFVMAGKQNYVENNIRFLSTDIALVRSKNIRKGQQWSDGSQMDDRHINHLRVFQKENDDWKIVSHMISQAQEKK
jgi:uncharacterized protein (TIGR02246 family)